MQSEQLNTFISSINDLIQLLPRGGFRIQFEKYFKQIQFDDDINLQLQHCGVLFQHLIDFIRTGTGPQIVAYASKNKLLPLGLKPKLSYLKILENIQCLDAHYHAIYSQYGRQVCDMMLLNAFTANCKAELTPLDSKLELENYAKQAQNYIYCVLNQQDELPELVQQTQDAVLCQLHSELQNPGQQVQQKRSTETEIQKLETQMLQLSIKIRETQHFRQLYEAKVKRAAPDAAHAEQQRLADSVEIAEFQNQKLRDRIAELERVISNQ